MIQKTKKILAGIIGTSLIILLLSLANRLAKSPVLHTQAKKSAKQYVAAKYGHLNLEIGDCSDTPSIYGYEILVTSPTSIDTTFSVYASDHGGAFSDNYVSQVSYKQSTVSRLEKELQTIVDDTVVRKFNHDIDFLSIVFAESYYSRTNLKLDMKLDIHHPPIPLAITLVLSNTDVSYKKVAELANDLNRLLTELEIPVVRYSIYIKPLDQESSVIETLSISDFPTKLLNKPNLPLVMEQFEAARVAELNKQGR